MRVILYKYNGASDVVNKVDIASVVYDSADSKGFEVYGGFSPYAAEFELSSLHSANFCRYLYNGIWYYGAVVVSTTSRGLYKYTVTVDPLTTAWYLGCLNVNAMVQYAPMTDIIQQDARLTFSNNSIITAVAPTVDYDFSDHAVILTVIDPYSYFENTKREYYQTPTASRAYVFRSVLGENVNAIQNFKNFIKNIALVDAVPFKNMAPAIASIQSACVVPSILAERDDGENNSGTITLHCIPSNAWEANVTHSIHIDRHATTDVEEIPRFYYGADEIDAQNPFLLSPISLEWDITEFQKYEMRCVDWSITIPYVCNINISPNSLIPDDATKLLVKVAYNVFGNFYSVILGYSNGLTGVYFHNNVQTFPVQESIQIPRSDHENNSIFGALSSAVSMIASAASQNYAGAVTSGIGVASSVKSAISSSNSSVGQTGGSPSRHNQFFTTQSPLLTIVHHPYETEQHTFAQKFGYPCNKVMNIQNIPSGYIQTRDIVLDCCGLPDDIVKAAQDMCNAGFRKV